MFQLWNWRIGLCLLGFSMLVWGAPPLLALDLFGKGAREQSGLIPISQTAQLPSLAEVAKNAMPAVVNISTTQKVEQRQRQMPPQFPMPGPSPFGGGDPYEEFFRRFFGERPPAGPQRSLGSGLADAIVSEDYSHIRRFLREIDSATVYANASTRVTDGYEFGVGAEV
ncbi:MAG: hypothetical protein ACRERD_14080, partial [Candidatus Binatia bacterium]